MGILTRNKLIYRLIEYPLGLFSIETRNFFGQWKPFRINGMKQSLSGEHSARKLMMDNRKFNHGELIEYPTIKKFYP